jgi:hypothetical protein
MYMQAYLHCHGRLLLHVSTAIQFEKRFQFVEVSARTEYYLFQKILTNMLWLKKFNSNSRCLHVSIWIQIVPTRFQ